MNAAASSTPIKASSSRKASIDDRLLRMQFNVKRRQQFYADLASFVSEGIPPQDAIRQIAKVAKPRRRMKWLYKLMTHVSRGFAQGHGIARALQNWIPPAEAALLVAGEQGARLKEALTELAELLHKQLEVKKSLVKELAPAALMTAVLVALMVYILNTVLKEARGLVPDSMFAQMSLAPAYFNLGDVFLKALPYLVAGFIVLSIVVSISLPRWKPGKFRQFLDQHVPPYNLYARTQSSFFLITVSSMMQAGAPFQQAVGQIQRLSSPWSKWHMSRMLARLASGKAEADAMQTGMLPWDVEDRLSIYRMLDDFKKIMHVTARDSMEILLRRVQILGGAIRAFVMVLLGAFIIFTIFSIGEIALQAQSAISQVQRG